MEKKYKRIPFDLELAKAITKGEKKGRIMANVGKGNIELFTLPFLEVPDEQEFEEGDVVFQKHKRCSWLSLLKDNVEYGQEIFTHDYVDMYVTGINKWLIEYDSYSDAAEEIRFATPEEKQMLIDALKKDSSDKAREYLKRFFGIEVEPKFNAKD